MAKIIKWSLLGKSPHYDTWESIRVNNEAYLRNAEVIRKDRSLKMREQWMKMHRQYTRSLKTNEEWWKITSIIANEQDRPDLLSLAHDKMDDLKPALKPTPEEVQDTLLNMRTRINKLELIPLAEQSQEQDDELDFLNTMIEKFYDYIERNGNLIDWSSRPDFTAVLRMARFAKSKVEYAHIIHLLAQLPLPPEED